jgi:HAD superfamily hydrolase (TIGR01509 family)
MTPAFALLFDLDGTLVDTDHLHHAAFAGIVAQHGRELSWADYRDRIMGKPNVEIMAWLLPEAPERHAEIADRKEAAYRGMLAERIEPIAGVHALLDWAAAEGAGTALVTNAPRLNAEAVLAATGLDRRFETVVIGDECAAPKPDPAPYREAMRRLGVTPSRSIAFEDSRSGLRAARGAGAHVFGLSTALPAAELLQAGAHQVIPDFTDPSLWVALQSLKARVA